MFDVGASTPVGLVKRSRPRPVWQEDMVRTAIQADGAVSAEEKVEEVNPNIIRAYD
jgi:hypothetical protein